MCDFHSIIVHKNGQKFHLASNSHSEMVEKAGWRENTDFQTNFVECEWDGLGEYDLKKVVSLRNDLKLEDLTNKQVRTIDKHYQSLKKVMDGDLKPIFEGGLLHGMEYWDVYLEAFENKNSPENDRLKVKKELMTVIVGGKGVATVGYKGTAIAGDCGTAIAGERGTATAGVGGAATAENGGTAIAGYRGAAKAGAYGTATAGDEGIATAGYEGTATAGWEGTAIAGDSGTATAGDSGTATAGYEGTATTGDFGTAITGYLGNAQAGLNGIISILFYNKKENFYQRKCAEVDGKKIKADVKYRLDEEGNFVEC